jgi:hypothetical protein
VTQAVEAEIREIVDREPTAWERKTSTCCSRSSIATSLGRFDAERGRRAYGDLFDAYELVHSRRRIVTLQVSDANDGAFAVVDIGALWRHRVPDEEMRWQGRVCKVYALVGGEWKLTQHTGALDPLPRASTLAP